MRISKTLPVNLDILADTIRVVFIGSTLPRREQLTKVLTVRRSKVFEALTYLQQNHPMYSDITVNVGVSLPEDDIPDVIWDTMVSHKDADEDSHEHSNYAPHGLSLTDTDEDSLIMESSGMLDLEGNCVESGDQIRSAVQHLKGTLLVPLMVQFQ